LVVALHFVGAELNLRLVVTPLIKIKPVWREPLLTSTMRRLTTISLWIMRRVGGMRIDNLPGIRSEAGVLIVMNHQSLADIPVACEFIKDGYPRFVTRKRYASGFPLISYMLRLYEHPLVDPGARGASQLRALVGVGRDSTQAVLIFPEGSRTRDGEIRAFRTPGVKALLTSRPWKVYGVVVDGVWRSARVWDWVKNMSSIHVRVESLGPVAFSSQSDEEAEAFVQNLRDRMCEKLADMRKTSAAIR
jgi:1-acyl-sn-glycerol-3-phosphate acyltransferase